MAVEPASTPISREAEETQVILRPLLHTGKWFLPVTAVLAAGTAWLGFSFGRQIAHGHVVTGQGNYNAMWGVVVANIINLIGISHVGIAISAVVRIFRLEKYKQLARVAELVTLVALTTAVLNIAMDVGRPDRFIYNVIRYGRWPSPFVWSATVITTYFTASAIYLYLAMRRDLARCAALIPRRRRLYAFLSLGYEDRPEEHDTHDRTLWWLALVILPIMISVHSVYGWIFGLQAGRPGWFNPIQAPYFVLGAIVSGFSTVILVAAIVRRVYGWQDYITPKMIRGLGTFLTVVIFFYMYFFFSEQLTAHYASPAAESAVSDSLIKGRFAVLFWSTSALGLALPFGMLFVQAVSKKIVSVTLTVSAASLVFIALWIKRFILVVPSFAQPLLGYKTAVYRPTFTEWSLVIASYFFAALLYSLVLKIVPVLELPDGVAEGAEPAGVRLALPPRSRRLALAGTVAAGIVLIALGATWRDQTLPHVTAAALQSTEVPHGSIAAPAVWLAGILALLTLPLQLCLVKVRRGRRSVGRTSERGSDEAAGEPGER